MTLEILFLLLAFQAKHLIADYYLQFPYMYENKGKPAGWIKPLFDHAGIHAMGTFVIIHFYLIGLIPEILSREAITILLSVSLFDFATHFITDRIKAIQPEGPDTKRFWTNLGWDQLAHHTVGILIIFYITTQG